MEELQNLIIVNRELIEISHHRIVFDDSILMILASAVITIAFFSFYLFIVFRRDVNEKLSQVGAILQKAEEALLLVREHSINAKDQRIETRQALCDMRIDANKSQTMVVGAIEEAVAKAVAASPVAPGATEANPIQVHLT